MRHDQRAHVALVPRLDVQEGGAARRAQPLQAANNGRGGAAGHWERGGTGSAALAGRGCHLARHLCLQVCARPPACPGSRHKWANASIAWIASSAPTAHLVAVSRKIISPQLLKVQRQLARRMGAIDQHLHTPASQAGAAAALRPCWRVHACIHTCSLQTSCHAQGRCQLSGAAQPNRARPGPRSVTCCGTAAPAPPPVARWLCCW